MRQAIRRSAGAGPGFGADRRAGEIAAGSYGKAVTAGGRAQGRGIEQLMQGLAAEMELPGHRLLHRPFLLPGNCVFRQSGGAATRGASPPETVPHSRPAEEDRGKGPQDSHGACTEVE